MYNYKNNKRPRRDWRATPI